jgi:hypothetical protein
MKSTNKPIGHLLLTSFFTVAMLGRAVIGSAEDAAVGYAQFKEPPAEYRGIGWMRFNLSNLSEEGVTASVQTYVKRDAWGSFMIEPSGGSTAGLSEAYLRASKRAASTRGVQYLSDDFFKYYRLAIEEGLKNKFPLSTLYDEWMYPSGMVGGLFYTKYPQLAAKSLEMAEENVTGPAKTEMAAPAGAYVGAVMMNLDTHKRIDISGSKTDKDALSVEVPEGNWKVMVFYLNNAFRPQSRKGGVVDYLDREAVAKYIAMNFDPYYEHLKEFFGPVIKRTMYDEPSMHMVDGRMWTPNFNREFEKRFGYSPMQYYPALWYDIGPETAAARNALFGFRVDLYADNYIGQLAEWCEEHNIKLGGHQDQEEARNPVAIHGDLMKVFKHQQVPGHDDIYYPGRSNVSYKIVTSAAYNYDRPECFAETYAAYRAMSRTIWLRTAMDQFAMGINMQLGSRPRDRIGRQLGNRPQDSGSRPGEIGSQPQDTGSRPGESGSRPGDGGRQPQEIGSRSGDVGNQPRDIGPELDRFVGRMSYLLRGGRHVADVAVVYPIAALQAAYAFANPPATVKAGSSPGFYYSLEGGIVPPETDYMDLGEMLYRGLRVDYTYLHPDVLVGRCEVEKNKLVLNNKVNREEFRALILPGGEVLSADAAKRVLDFYRGGGTVIATHKLPSKSAEFGRDKEVRDMVYEVFGISSDNPMTARVDIVVDDFKDYFVKTDSSGGHGYFLPQPDISLLNAVLKEAIAVRDVDIKEPPMWPVKMGTAYDGALTYLHKVKDGRDIYFFANSTDKPVETKVALRGDKELAIWNPHTGEREDAEIIKSESGGQAVTTVNLVLPPVTSTFFVEE